MNLKTKTFELKADNGTITGYASTWTREPDSYGDVVAKGAFAECLEKIKKDGKVLPLLFNHEGDDLNAYIGTVIDMGEDDHGLKFTAAFDDTKEGQRARELAMDGRLAKFSFAYDVLEQGTVTLEDGREANELRKLNIHEVSLVLYPANPDTSVVSVKVCPDVESMKNKIAEFIAVELVKSGRRNSAKDERKLTRITELLEEIQGIVNSLLADEQDDDPMTPDDNPEDPEPDNGEDQKARITELLKEAEEILKKGD